MTLTEIAAGYDQELLVEVEQALRRESPWALAPASRRLFSRR